MYAVSKIHALREKSDWLEKLMTMSREIRTVGNSKLPVPLKLTEQPQAHKASAYDHQRHPNAPSCGQQGDRVDQVRW
jgi:hypothetical protein